MLGGLSQAQLAKAYAACDAFVIPTHALECFGLIAVEALASGVPVLSTNVGALPETIAPLESQWIMHADAAAIAHQLERFLRGELPRHTPQELRAYAHAHFGDGARRSFVDVATKITGRNLMAPAR